MSKKFSKSRKLGRPFLRDIEWKVFRYWEEARGFSGFELDPNESCNRLLLPVTDPRSGETLPLADEELRFFCQDDHGELMQDKYNNLYKKDGTRKKYVNTRDYLKRQFPQSMGKPIYYNQSKNMIMMGPRGWGKSYIGGNLAAHEFLMSGVTDYDIYMEDLIRGVEHPRTNTIVAAGDAKYSSATLSKTWMTLENLPGEQEIGDKYYPSPFSQQMVGSLHPGKVLTAKYQKKMGGNWVTKGSQSTIKNRTFRDNPFAAQGERSSVMIWDEIGMFNNFRESYATCVDVQQIDSWKFGSSLFTGTGGDFEGKGTIDAKYMFYHPDEFDCITYNNEWEKIDREIGFFLPSEYADMQFKNGNGDTTPELAAKGRKYYEDERIRLSSNKGDSLTLDNFIVYHPLVPSDVFLSKSGNVFPVAELQNRLTRVREYEIEAYVGKKVALHYEPESITGVDYKLNLKGEPINEFPYKGSNREGCLMIYDFPETDDQGKVPSGLYLIGHDPYATDANTGDSLGSIYVIKTKAYPLKYGHDEIVAQYVGRPFQGRAVINEILLQLSMFYGNAKVYFENAVGNVKEFFEKRKKLYLLAKQPQTVLTKKASFVTGAAQIYGYPMSSRAIKQEAILYLRDWLLEEREAIDGVPLRNLDRINDEALLEELIAFNWEGNFDRVMGLAGCIVGLEETHNQYKKVIEQEVYENHLSFLTSNKSIFGKSSRGFSL